MLENKVSVGLKLILVVVLLSVVHALSSVLGNLGIITDLLLILGAYEAFKLGTNSEERLKYLDKIDDFIDVDELSVNLVDLVNLFLNSKNSLEDLFYNEEEEEEDVTV